MAAQTADISVSVEAYSDVGETRPRDDQAVVLEVDREVSLREYLEKLNEHIDDPKSFMYASRISGERLCVVMATARQAARLVDELGAIEVNNKIVPIKYYVAKSVKVIISNALYGVTNSAIKRFLTKDRGIRTASSVSEFKLG